MNIEDVLDGLEDIEYYFDNKSDADYDGLNFIPNDEMRLLMVAREIKKFIIQEKDQPHKQKGET